MINSTLIQIKLKTQLPAKYCIGYAEKVMRLNITSVPKIYHTYLYTLKTSFDSIIMHNKYSKIKAHFAEFIFLLFLTYIEVCSLKILLKSN